MTWFQFNPDVDGSITLQKTLTETIHHRENLRHLEPHLRLWANSKGYRQFQDCIAALRKLYPQPWLTWLGSGDLHHLTAIMLETLPDTLRPITLVLIDNHPDWFVLPPRYHCGNWIAGLLRYPWIESIVLVGQDSDDIIGRQYWLAPLGDLKSGRVQLFPYRKRMTTIPLHWPRQVKGVKSIRHRLQGTQLHFSTLEAEGVAVFAKGLSAMLQGKNVYISLDKDCLKASEAATDWDQGVMSVEEVCAIIRACAEGGTLIGIDICGEQAPEPLAPFLKQVDAGRLLKKSPPLTQQQIECNESTNLKLLRCVNQLPVEGPQSHPLGAEVSS